MALLPTNEYKPYKPRARWRKWIHKHIEHPLYKAMSHLSNQAYLYLQTNRIKRERNLKKGRQKKQYNYHMTMRSRALLLTLLTASGPTVSSLKFSRPFTPTSQETCCMGASKSATKKARIISFDTDSFDILVDNGASRSITNNRKDFIDTPRLVRTVIEGYSGTSEASLIGTVRWTIADDQGLEHNIILPNTILDEKAKKRILSPQHWSQTANDHYPNKYGTWCATLDDQIILLWDQRKYSRSIPLEPNKTNVGIMRSASGTTKYCKSCVRIEDELGQKLLAMPTIFESTDELTTLPQVTDSESEGDHEIPHRIQNPQETITPENASTPITLDMLFQEQDEPDLPQQSFDAKEQEYQHWHTKLGHLNKTRMRQLATNGMIPKYLARLEPPFCSACIYGKATKTPWRTKSQPTKTPRTVTRPGECIAVDQLESTVPGFIGQLKGNLTKQRYRYATVFVDMLSDYTYITFHTKLTSEETLRAKHAFEAHAETLGVQVRNYHADNGRFQDLLFKEDCHQKGQMLSFCGVNAHFQNGKAEKKIRDLQDAARTSLLHAIRKWPKVITVNLWPYAMRYANDVNNSVPNKGETKSPLEKFSGTQNRSSLRHFHHFGCPTYVLDSNLQANKSAGYKWKERARLGVNLGFSPQHARSVHLILSLTSGCVSPQFHCTFDDHFKTTNDYVHPESTWQEKAHFVTRLPQKREKDMEDLPPSIEQTTELPSEEPFQLPNPTQQHDDIATMDFVPLEIPQPPDPQPAMNMDHNEAGLRRSQRARKQPVKFKDYIPHEQVAFESLFQFTEEQPQKVQAMKAIHDPDTLYLWEAMKEPDADKFLEAMQQEVDDHTNR